MDIIRVSRLSSLRFPSESNENTKSSYFFQVKKFNRWNKGESISPDRIHHYLKFLKENGTRSSSIRAAKSALKKAILTSLPVESNNIAFITMLDKAFREMKVDKTKYGLKESAVLTRKEVQHLCKNTPKKLSLMIKALCNSGFRVSELINIRIKDCTITDNKLSVTIIRKRGKEVTIPEAFPVALYWRIVKTFHGESPEKHLYLFRNSRSSRGSYSRQYLWQEIKKYSERVLGKPTSVHGCRHFHATSLLLSGAKIPEISRRLSHEKMSTTAEYYLHSKMKPETLHKSFIH
ncbi:tyrosine-type recombinase/integrase [Leptospira wolffii]|uniref:Tyrosine-type recombinase/integrase n=2 Tax=Leptospira wolffii TaxID=409998 RepID=A0ABV5BUN8_9LEPT